MPYAADLSLNTFSVAVWVNVSDIAGNRGIIGTRFNGDNTFDLKVSATLIHGDIGNGTAWLNTAVDVPVALSIGEWYHICYVFDDPADTVEMYVNGLLGQEYDDYRHAAVDEVWTGPEDRHGLSHRALPRQYR